MPIEIDIHNTKSQLEKGDITLIDCREQHEYDAASIAGAKLIPMSQFQLRITELDALEPQQIVIHCHHGVRSLQVANFLRQNGHPTAQSMAGGIDAWSLEIDSTISRY
jgi:rhodanese-related sulfurtransferase